MGRRCSRLRFQVWVRKGAGSVRGNAGKHPRWTGSHSAKPARAGGVTEWGSWQCQSESGRADATTDSGVMVFESAVAAERGPEAQGCGKLKRR